MTTRFSKDASEARTCFKIGEVRLDLVECIALEMRERFQAIQNCLDRLTPACSSAINTLEEVQVLADSGSAMTIQLLALFDLEPAVSMNQRPQSHGADT